MRKLKCYLYQQSRLKPGRMLLVDTQDKKIIQDVELKLTIAQSRPHSQWLKEQVPYNLLSNVLFSIEEFKNQNKT